MRNEGASVKSILLVEDDPLDAQLTLRALEAQHLAGQVAVVGDGAEALDYLHRRGKFHLRTGGDPVVVLLDNKMPKVSGLEVLKAIRADERLKSIPVVALTSSRESRDLTSFYEHGVNAYVMKPVGFADFLKAVEKLGVFWAVVNEPPIANRGEWIDAGRNGGPHRAKESP